MADADDSERDDDEEEWKTVASTKQQHMLEHNFPVVSYFGSFDDSLSFELAKGHLKIGSYDDRKDVAIGDVAANFTEASENRCIAVHEFNGRRYGSEPALKAARGRCVGKGLRIDIADGGCGECGGSENWHIVLQQTDRNEGGRLRLRVRSCVKCYCDGGDEECEGDTYYAYRTKAEAIGDYEAADAAILEHMHGDGALKRKRSAEKVEKPDAASPQPEKPPEVATGNLRAIMRALDRKYDGQHENVQEITLEGAQYYLDRHGNLCDGECEFSGKLRLHSTGWEIEPQRGMITSSIRQDEYGDSGDDVADLGW